MVPFHSTAAGHVNCYGYTCRSAASLNGTNSTPLVGFNFRVWRGATVTGFVPSLSGTSKENSEKKIQLLWTSAFRSMAPAGPDLVNRGEDGEQRPPKVLDAPRPARLVNVVVISRLMDLIGSL